MKGQNLGDLEYDLVSYVGLNLKPKKREFRLSLSEGWKTVVDLDSGEVP